MSEIKTGPDMDLARFRAIVEAYGGEPSRWPRDERAAAEAFLGSSRDARILVEQEAALDTLLDTQKAPMPSAALMGRILETAQSEREKTAGSLMGRLTAVLGFGAGRVAVRPIPVLVAAASFGLAVGILTPQTEISRVALPQAETPATVQVAEVAPVSETAPATQVAEVQVEDDFFAALDESGIVGMIAPGDIP